MIDTNGRARYRCGVLKEERHKLILRSIEGRDAVSYEDLLAIVDASSATLRRDVEQLYEVGKLRKVRGGVAPMSSLEFRAPSIARPLQS